MGLLQETNLPQVTATMKFFIILTIAGMALADGGGGGGGHAHGGDHHHAPHDSHDSYGSPQAPPVYTPPQQTYGAPEPTYGAPEPAYGAPAQTYGAPEPTYGAPEPAYGAPEQTYGAPEPTYGAPEQTYGAPEPTYGAPEPTYGAPEQTYGAPAAPQYGAPQYNETRETPTAYNAVMEAATSMMPGVAILPLFLAIFAAVIVGTLFAPLLGFGFGIKANFLAGLIAPFLGAWQCIINAVLNIFGFAICNVGVGGAAPVVPPCIGKRSFGSRSLDAIFADPDTVDLVANMLYKAIDNYSS